MKWGSATSNPKFSFKNLGFEVPDPDFITLPYTCASSIFFFSGSMSLGVALMFLGVDLERGWVILAGALSLLGLLIAGVALARILAPSHIGPVYARFKGCGPDFLASLPTYLGGR